MTDEGEGAAVVREMAAYIRAIYRVDPTPDQLEHLWDLFSGEAETLFHG